MIDEVYGEAIKSIAIWWRQKTLVALGLMVPIILIFFFTQAFNVTQGVGFPTVVVNQDLHDTQETMDLIAALKSTEGTVPHFIVIEANEDEALELFHTRKTFSILWIPEGFSEAIREGKPVDIPVMINNIHEDLSKNLRLGFEGRLFEYTQKHQLVTRPGISYDVDRIYASELKRVDYMQMGALVFVSMFLSMFFGGVLGAEEKDKGNFREIQMAHHGIVYAKLGKIAGTMAITSCLVSIILLMNRLYYRVFFPNMESFYAFVLVFLSLSFMFSALGVSYGLWVGNFTLIPVPTMLLSFTLWIISGAINPLEFSAGPDVFKMLPTASAIRILTSYVFGRGSQYVSSSWLIQCVWTFLSIVTIIIFSIRDMARG